MFARYTVNWCSDVMIDDVCKVHCQLVLMCLQGALSIGVPGEVHGYYKAWTRYGRLPWRRLIQPTIDLCINGYHVEWALAKALKDKENIIRNNPGLR